MKNHQLLRSFLLPFAVIGLLMSSASFFYAFNHHLQTIEAMAAQETLKVSNLLSTARTLVGEHVLSSIALLKHQSLRYGPPAIEGYTAIHGERIPNLVFGSAAQTGNIQLVNDVTRIGSGTATLFVRNGEQFIRIATNVKKADGSNAFGTALDPHGKAIVHLLNRQPFYGVVDILGEAYLSRYEPMFDQQNQLIGAWYVGYKLDLYALDQAIKQWRFMDRGFVVITDGKGAIRFLSKNVSKPLAELAVGQRHARWIEVRRYVPAWDFDIHLFYPKEYAYLEGIKALSPWFVIFMLIALAVLAVLGFNLKRFVLNPLGGDPETARAMLMRIEHGDFTEDDTHAPAHTLIASIVVMRSRLRTLLQTMQQNTERLQISANVFEHAHDAIFITDNRGLIVQTNPSFSQLTGLAASDCLNQTPAALGLAHRDNGFFSAFFAQRKFQEWKGEVWNLHANGHEYLVGMELFPVLDDYGQLKHYVGLFADITQAKQQQLLLEHMAYHDALTQLPNRILFSEKLQLALLDAEKRKHAVAIGYIDLDDFKIVNDQHGHACGDKLLQLLAKRMQGLLSPQDTLARLGGDEFALLLSGPNTSREFASKMQKLLTQIEKPFVIDQLKFSISASIGYTVFPIDQNPPDTLLRHADHAMYYAKTHGGRQVHLFDLASAYESQQEQLVMRDLLQAIRQEELKLIYQPQVCVQTGRVVGFEALLRWQHPQHGLLNPGEFLALIEHSSLICDIGQWVIRQSLQQLATWNAQGVRTKIAVNIAAFHLMQKPFAKQIQKLLKQHTSVASEQLQLEITESAAIHDFDKANLAIQQCRALGISFSIDDFGAGYSSLIYLRKLPVDMIKIDRSFVHSMLNNEEDLAVIRGVITMCREFQREVVAEGVEQSQQVAILAQLGCHYVQGYRIAKGLQGPQVLEWLQKNQPFHFD